MQRFPLRRSPWALPFLAPLAGRRPYATVDGERIVVRMGLIGRAEIPLAQVDRVGTMDWPWWGGLGARIARGLVAFVGASGRVVLVELSSPVRVRAPLGWSTRSVAIGAEDIDGLIEAIAQARRPMAAGPD